MKPKQRKIEKLKRGIRGTELGIHECSGNIRNDMLNLERPHSPAEKAGLEDLIREKLAVFRTDMKKLHDLRDELELLERLATNPPPSESEHPTNEQT